jgi:hypothetical protein
MKLYLRPLGIIFSIRMNSMSEKHLYQQIIHYLNLCGCYAYRASTGCRGNYRFGKKGQCDITGCTATGRRIEIEVKTEVGVLSDEQILFMAEMKKRGAIVILARSLDDVIKGFL